MNAVVNKGGSITVDGQRLHGYKVSVWLSTYNLEHDTKFRPSTMTEELVRQFLREVPKPYLRQ